MTARLQYLEYRLLLTRRLHTHAQAMVDCAREMLELVVLTWVQRDRFSEQHHNYDWMLMCWGVPSSGVLCVELLRQVRNPSSRGPTLPRSEIVQNLSLLVGFLEWVRPAAGNYQLCSRMRLIIKRILDQILNPAPMEEKAGEKLGTEKVVVSEEERFDGTGFAMVDGDAVFDDGLDDLDWLNNVDWSRGPWIDLGGLDYSVTR